MKRFLLIVGGTLLGLFFLYLAFRGVSWSEFLAGVKQMEPAYLVPAFLLLMLGQLVRALRFGVIVSPFCKLGTKALWDVLNIWGAANMVMPARLAEFVRPYLLQRRGASFSSSLGAVMVERLFDLGGLLFLLAVVLWKTPQVSSALSSVGLVMLCGLLVGYAFVLAILARRQAVESLLTRILGVLPHRAAEFLGGVLRRLIDGFSIMSSFRHALMIFAYS
ncbi:MAG: flippase-like domain-containing protein, partial [Deltaproteobacteria bacterium]|nr:flippase-like domain-containing protein [Deltaproteobacteria bacterium]